MKNILLAVIYLAVLGGLLFLIYASLSNKEVKMYTLAFRKKSSSEDYFWLDKDYCFEEYHVAMTGRYWLADPFLFEYGGKGYVFYEAFDLWTGKGNIGVSTLDPENKTLSVPRIVLSRNYHFSWPNVFEYEGEIYMLPETCEDYRVKLFRAVNFPYEWTEDEILVNDIFSCDSIMLNDGNKRYLLTSDQYHNTPTGSYPSCYVKNTLFTFNPEGSLTLEPDGKIDPFGKVVARGDYGIRNAGQAFIAQGMLIRPGQDCRYKQYGRGIVFFRLNSIEPYEEEELFSVDCENISSHIKQDFVKELIGLHTYNTSINWEVIDFAGMRSNPVIARVARKIYAIMKRLRKIL